MIDFNKQATYLTLPEYTTLAKKVLSRYASGTRQTDELISHVVYWLALADSRYKTDIGTIEGFRWSYGRFAVLKYFEKIKRLKKKERKANFKIEEISEIIEEELGCIDDDILMNSNEVFLVLSEMASISQRDKQVYQDYYSRGLTLQEIGDKYLFSKENARLIIAKVTNILKDRFKVKT